MAKRSEAKSVSVKRPHALERIEKTVVHEIARNKYSCRACGQGVATAPWRGRVIEKGLLGPGFLAHIVTERSALDPTLKH